ncbi:MAG: hypothetical protein OJF51_004876 [Nitrospira sp.]|jgi:hypothetical protein|nr:MAG: hypothetical protein OJF51_004876 [Nitrospira sp.]
MHRPLIGKETPFIISYQQLNIDLGQILSLVNQFLSLVLLLGGIWSVSAYNNRRI